MDDPTTTEKQVLGFTLAEYFNTTQIELSDALNSCLNQLEREMKKNNIIKSDQRLQFVSNIYSLKTSKNLS
jgi:hypothetical protein